MNRFTDVESVKIKRVGTVDHVAQHLRAMISDGRLPQGERLPEIPLSAALGVSRNTLRDAIRILAGEGLVQHELHRGAVVRTLSAADVGDIYRVRRMLELGALAMIPKAAPAARERLGAALDACERALQTGDYTTFVEHELEFHGAIVSLLNSERLDRFFSQVVAELRLVFGELASDSEPDTSRRILGLYRRLLRAAEKGDDDRAARLLAGHLDAYEKRLTAVVAPDTETPLSARTPA